MQEEIEISQEDLNNELKKREREEYYEDKLLELKMKSFLDEYIINHELSKYKSELDELTKEKESLLNKKEILNQKISEIEEENNNYEDAINNLNEQIAKAENDSKNLDNLILAQQKLEHDLSNEENLVNHILQTCSESFKKKIYDICSENVNEALKLNNNNNTEKIKEKKTQKKNKKENTRANKEETLNVLDSETKLDNSNDEDNNNEEADSQPLNVKLTYADFEPIKLLGRGSFGEVLLVRLKANKKVYAMKILNKKLLKIKKQQTHTKTERDLMVKINSPFIVNIKSAFQDISKLYIVSEFMQGGDMFFHMHDGRIVTFNNEKARFYVMELVLALESLHKHNMVYRDLKPENILLDAKGHVKLTDFGLSKILENEEDKAFTICGTPQYLAPEVIQKKGYDKAVDWWSLGCVMYEMLTGKIPFAIKRGVKLNMSIYEQGVNYPSILTNNAKDLIKKLLILNPSERLGSGPDGIEKVKNHPYFNGVSWKDVLQKKIRPPFIPKLKDDTDLKYFDTMFTDEPINGPQRKNTNRDRDREPSNEYTGFTYVTGSVSNELMTFAKVGDNDSE